MLKIVAMYQMDVNMITLCAFCCWHSSETRDTSIKIYLGIQTLYWADIVGSWQYIYQLGRMLKYYLRIHKVYLADLIEY